MAELGVCREGRGASDEVTMKMDSISKSLCTLRERIGDRLSPICLASLPEVTKSIAPGLLVRPTPPLFSNMMSVLGEMEHTINSISEIIDSVDL